MDTDLIEYQEWRVTGTPGGAFERYDFTWSPLRNPHLGDPERAARGFVALIKSANGGTPWEDGPHLSHRTVTVTEWTAEPA